MFPSWCGLFKFDFVSNRDSFLYRTIHPRTAESVICILGAANPVFMFRGFFIDVFGIVICDLPGPDAKPGKSTPSMSRFRSIAPRNLIVQVSKDGNENSPEPLHSFMHPRIPLKLVTARWKNLLESWNPYSPKRIAKSAAGSANWMGDIYDVDSRRRKKTVRIAHGPCIGFITPGCGRSSFFFTALLLFPSPFSFLLTALVRSLIYEARTISCPSLFPLVHLPI